MQEVESLAGLDVFDYGYLFKMIGRGYVEKVVSEGNDSRGIEVAVMMGPQTMDGQPIV